MAFSKLFGQLEPFERHIQAVGGSKVLENNAGIVWELKDAETDELFAEICVHYGLPVQIWLNRVLVAKDVPETADEEDKPTNADVQALNRTLFRKEAA